MFVILIVFKAKQRTSQDKVVKLLRYLFTCCRSPLVSPVPLPVLPQFEKLKKKKDFQGVCFPVTFGHPENLQDWFLTSAVHG